MQEGINNYMTAKLFKPTYLYVKTHNKTGLKYFGKTSNKNPYKYQGSGKRWQNHLKVHGYDVTTEIIGYYTDEQKCRNDALRFGKEFNIVNSSEWANLMEERMDGGPVCEESIEKLKQTQIETQGGVMKRAREKAYTAESKAKRLATLQERYGSTIPFMKRSADWREKLIERNSGNIINRGRIGIMKDGVKKLIHPVDLEKFESEGWSRGYKN